VAKLITVIIPVHNEQTNIPLVYKAVRQVFGNLKKYQAEIIFVNDGSTDKSQLAIEALSKKDRLVKSIEFSKNFGKEQATTAGLHNAKGLAAVLIDADMQHPPKLITEFIKRWEKGADMVIAIRVKNTDEGFIKHWGSELFYKIMNIMGEAKIAARATDFRLIDRKVINEYNKFTEHNRITRGLLDWLGFKKDYVEFIADKRASGKASYNKIKLLKLAMSAFISHSLFPLQLAGYLGIISIVLSGPLGFFMIINNYVINDPFSLNFSGPAMLATFNMFMIGIVLGCLGLM